ncbi:MAG TPA: SdiA-regulated domain-containing protein [Chitinophagaceae bacterium]|nr:SdiA-regulated domain-containing protein [Chitinophagaceae bacterium]
MNKNYLLVLLIVGLSCSGQKQEYKSPAGYDFNQPKKFIMPESLNEISGISFYKGSKDTLYAEEDEDGKLYYLHPGDKKATIVRFAKGGDYEDIAILNEQVIILKSDGKLFVFPIAGKHQDEVANVKEWKGLLPEGEFEGMYADEKNSQLWILCKHCGDDETTKAITAYMLIMQPDGTLTSGSSATLSVKTIEKLTGEKKFKFHPSALGRSPITGQWFIVSAVNKMLVIADKDWNVKEVYPLNPSLFRQPEGIAFDNENNLYISNEGDELSDGNVLKFVFKK